MNTPIYVGFDTETYLIEPGLLAPPLVVASFCSVVENGAWLALRDDALTAFENMLDDEKYHLVIHNAPFDLAVMCAERPSLLPKVFAALDAGRIHCTRVRDMMLHNAREGLTDDRGPKTGFHLSDLVLRRFAVNISDTKNDPDAWRLRYGELDGKSLNEWPDEAKTYAKDDAVWHLRVFMEQEKEAHNTEAADPDCRPLHDEPGQTRAAFALHLMALYGVRTDETAVQALEAELSAHVAAAHEKLKEVGLLRGKPKKDKETGLVGVEWSKDTKKIKALVEEALGDATPRTDPSDKFPEGQVKTDEETLLSTGHPDLLVLAEVGSDAKVLSTFVPALKGIDKKGNQRALRLPDGWLLNPGWNALVSTGRTSCRAPNLQNPPRKGNVRPCFVPRPGHWYLSVDYSFIEMVCWAQTCLDLLGRSTLADAIIAGKDPHCLLARNLLAADGHEHTYEEVLAAKNTWAKPPRKTAKAGNFGLMGGMGPDTFSATARNDGLDISPDQARTLKYVWMDTWDEAREYFAHVTELQRQAFGQAFTVTLPRTGFVRGGCTFTSGCNTYFQGLAARGAKEAMWLVAKECYLDTTSPLYGCRPVLFLHDEFILEVPADRMRAHLASKRLQEVMIAGMARFVPDVPVKVEPTLMERWYKEAEPVWGPNGVLEIWRPTTPDDSRLSA